MSWLRREKTSSPNMERDRHSSKLPSKTAGSMHYSPAASPTMPLKSGDDERIRIMMMVKEGKMTIEGALQTAYGLGVASAPYEDVDDVNKGQMKRRNYSKTGVHNFGVLKFSRSNISTKCVLQIDFQEQVFCLIVRGITQEQKDFMDLKGVDSEDGSTRLSVFLFDATELDLDIGSLEDKNKVVRLFNVILEGNSDVLGDTADESVGGDEDKEGRVIKESLLEKRGHSAAFLMWTKRFVRVKHGELCYFKAGEEKNQDAALCVIQLKHGQTLVKKLDQNGFVLVTDKKEYSFRLPASVAKQQSEIEKERDDWIIAVQEGSRPSRIRSIIEPSVALPDRDFHDLSLKQENYLKSVVGTLQEELEQLQSILTIVDAPFKASVQVKRVREVVRSLDQEVRSGILSWNIKSNAQAAQKSLLLGRENKVTNGSVQVSKKGSDGQPVHDSRHYPYTYAETSLPVSTSTFKPTEPATTPVDTNNDVETSKQTRGSGGITRDRSRDDKEYTTVQYVDQGFKVNFNSDSSEANDTGEGSESTQKNDNGQTERQHPSMYAQVNKERSSSAHGDLPKSDVAESEGKDLKPDNNEVSVTSNNGLPPALPVRESSLSSDVSGDLSPSSEGSVSASSEQSIPMDSHIPTGSPTSSPPLPVLTGSPTPSLPPPAPAIGVPPPPPPPTIIESKLPPKGLVEPNVKLKQWFWTKIPDGLVPGSVWMDAAERLDAFDLKELEKLFGVEGPKKAAESVRKPSTAVAQPKTLLDPKKAQNLGIFLSGFKINAEDVEHKLNILSDREGLTIEQIMSLKRFQPTTEEADLFRNFEGNKDDLSSVDRFIMKMSDIPNLSSRLDLLMTIMEFPTLYEDIGPAVEGLAEAYRNLKNSRAFVRLLEYILAIGNYVNAGTNRGGAYGFKLTALTKLVEVRSADKQQNMLNFIVQQLYETDLEALKCYKEVPALLKPNDISIKGLEGEIDVMKKDLVKVKSIVDKMKGKELTNRKSDEKFVQETEDFRNTYNAKLEVLEKNCNEIKELALYLKTKFGEPSGNFQEWLNAVSEFFKHLERAVADEERVRLRLAQQAAKKARDEQAAKDSVPRKGLAQKADGKSRAVIPHAMQDSHLEAFKNNPLFRSKSPEQQSSEQNNEVTNNGSNDGGTGEFVKAGYLEKQSGGKQGSLKHKWERRYFEVTSSGYLYYYKKRDGKCAGSAYLRGCPVKQSQDDACVISIETEERLWNIRASNEFETVDWLKILRHYASKSV